MDKWIKCSERLPEKSSHSNYSKSVIVFREPNRCQHIATYDSFNDEWQCFFSGWTVTHVTHWMPLPESPKND